MKKQKMLFMGILLIGIMGFVIALTSYDRNIDIDDNKLDVLKRTLNKEAINPTTSDIVCDFKECFATIKQEGVINTEWREIRNYCLKEKECDFEKEPECEYECLEYRDYTDEELKDMLDKYIKKRLELFADAQAEREAKESKEAKVGGGIATLV